MFIKRGVAKIKVLSKEEVKNFTKKQEDKKQEDKKQEVSKQETKEQSK